MRFSKLLNGSLLAAAIAAMALPAFADDAPAPKIRVVACDAQVQSRKRGLCANDMSAEDFKAIAPGVSWFYTWNFEPTANAKVPDGCNIEFIPMVWGKAPEQLEGLKKYLKTGAKPRAIMAINEPNLKDQAFISPLETATLYKNIKAVADEYKIPVIGPNMSLGSPAEGSITADDPIDGKKTTYTFMVPFLKATLFYLDKDKVSCDTLAWHGYGQMGEFGWAVKQLPEAFGKKQWVTEYAFWKADNDESEIRFMIESTDLMERSDNVTGYAWFKERVTENKKLSILAKDSGKLTKLGEIYVKMPVHESDLYYQIPGKLEASRYVKAEDINCIPAREKDAFLEVQTTSGAADLSFNLNTAEAGDYTLDMHVNKAGEILILDSAKKEMATVETKNNWQDASTTLKLAAGPQTIRLHFDTGGMAITALTFKKK
jgi:hypothetical protein